MKGLNLIVDINSGSVGAALAVFQKNKTPEIIFKTRLLLSKRKGEGNVTSVLECMEKLIKNVLKEKRMLKTDRSKRSIKKILCAVSVPWSYSKINTISIKAPEKEFLEITPKSLERLVREKNISNNGKKGIEIKNSKEDVIYKSVEHQIISTKINGYVTSNPFGKEAKSIEVTVFEGRVMKEIIVESLKIFDRFVFGDITIHSFTLVALNAIEKVFGSVSNYLIVEVSEDATNITLVKNGMIAGNIGFMLGKNLFLKNIVSELDVNPEIALSFIRLHRENKTEAGFGDKIGKIMKKTEDLWRTEYEKSVLSLESEISKIPSKIFLAADSDISEVFSQSFGEETLGPEKKEKTIVVPLYKSLSQFCEWGNGEPDLFLGMEAIFFNKSAEFPVGLPRG